MNPDWGYPRFLRRLQAVAIDSIILAVLIMGGLVVVSSFGVTGRDAVILVAVISMLWEPLLVSITGGTIGHHLIGLRVVSSTSGKNLNIVASLLRFMVKFLLGSVSVVFIFITRYHQALHDGLARSVVILKYPDTQPEYEVLSARQIELANYQYPPISFIMVCYYFSLARLRDFCCLQSVCYIVTARWCKTWRSPFGSCCG